MPATLAGLPRTLGVGAALLAGGSAGLLVARWVPSRLVRVQPDTWAMARSSSPASPPR